MEATMKCETEIEQTTLQTAPSCRAISLSVAPLCNLQCNFCHHQCDCANEGIVGKVSPALQPVQALDYLGEMIQLHPDISEVRISGPGEPFANPEETLETLRMVRAKYPQLKINIITNGLDLVPYIPALALLHIRKVTIAIHSFDPHIGAKLYAWVRDRKTNTPLIGLRGAGLLIQQQQEAIQLLKEKDIAVEVNTIVMTGINDAHIPALTQQLRGLSVDAMTCLPLIPQRGAHFEEMEETDAATLVTARQHAGAFVSQLEPLTNPSNIFPESDALLEKYSDQSAAATSRMCIAIASIDGLGINQNLGHAPRFLLFAPEPDSPSGYAFQEVRPAPPVGGGMQRWEQLAEILGDCRAVIASAIGEEPRNVLTQKNIRVYEMDEVPVHLALKTVFGAEAVPRRKNKREGCSGKGGGCGGSGC